MISSPFLPTKATIRSMIPLAPDNYLFQLQLSDASMRNCRPGQFIELWVPGVGECPISVCSGSVDGMMELCIRQVGRVTTALFQKQEGDWIGLRGPYGEGFPLDEYKGKDLVLIAGGLGVAPIRSLWQYILDNRDDFGKLIIIYGMRHSIDLLFRAEFKILMRRRDIEVYIAAEEIEGPALPPVSLQLGRVTDMLRLAPIDDNFQAAICGPPVMYKYVIKELEEKGLTHQSIWLSLERHMKCGVGKCGHCFVGGQFTCRKGPVFRLSDLEFLPEVIECS
ncbi:MAG: FAD/NAD(P)-binding protein [Candidatus Obscuribacterales bacterium]|nr:FAD/NAD(P)-binding protein [Candidatus Obscuribacterales bacterium]